MEQYKLIDMFEKIDASVLEGLHLEKDLKRKQRIVRKLFAKGYVKVVSIIAGISLTVTGILIIIVQLKKKRLRTV